MRPYIPLLDTEAMEWQATETPGLYTKPLSHDPENGARTAIQRIVVADGYAPPPTAHFHHMDEELFLLDGSFSFDGERWLGRHAYCFHPAETVHGFKSQVAGEATFISRVSRELDFNLVDQPRQFAPYNLVTEEPERPISIVDNPFSRQWEEVRNDAGQIVLSRLLLGRHPATGEGAMLVRFAPGWRSPHGDHFHTVYEEVYVVEGEVVLNDGTRYGKGAYMFKPPFTVQPGSSSRSGALVYICFGGPMDFRPAAELEAVQAGAR